MPSRNRVKLYYENAYYHIYNRGVNKKIIFVDDEDYRVFLNLLKRYVDEQPHKDKKGREYEWLRPNVTLAAYCLMPNHFHLLAYQRDANGITRLLRAVCTAYSGYFNKKYKRVGPLFQGVFKATDISSDDYLLHISRYIHLNPKQYRTWQYSSYLNYLRKKQNSWLDPSSILDLFNGDSYEDFVADYEDHKAMLDEIKYSLADYVSEVSKVGPWKRGAGL